MKPLCIEAPAVARDLEPGIDSLGLALEIADIVRVRFEDRPGEPLLEDVTGAYARALDPHENWLCRAYKAWGEARGKELSAARFSVEMRIPPGRGLGSRAASIVAGLAAAARAAEQREGPAELLDLAASLTASPGGTAATVLGGMTVAFLDGRHVHAMNVANHFTLGVALFIPDETPGSSATAGTLPERVSRVRAVGSIGRTAYLTTALLWGRWEKIGAAMSEGLYRHSAERDAGHRLDEVRRAAVEAGAYGAALSGRGPAIVALGPREHAEEFRSAMAEAAERLGWPGTAIVTGVREHGVTVKEEE